jgi:hypothetical protein
MNNRDLRFDEGNILQFSSHGFNRNYSANILYQHPKQDGGNSGLRDISN